MAFRKRNIGIQRTPQASTAAGALEEGRAAGAHEVIESIPGIRPSPLTGQATTSTGAYSLDSVLGGHAGLALGSSVLVEESGTTDFGGALLRYYAAEGIVQGHTVHVVGVGEQWVKDLPGLVGAADAAAEAAAQKKIKAAAADEEKMKIAWRYERLGQVDGDRPGRGAFVAPCPCPCSCLYRHFRHFNQTFLTAPFSQSSPIEHLQARLSTLHRHNQPAHHFVTHLIWRSDWLYQQQPRSITFPSRQTLHPLCHRLTVFFDHYHNHSPRARPAAFIGL